MCERALSRVCSFEVVHVHVHKGMRAVLLFFLIMAKEKRANGTFALFLQRVLVYMLVCVIKYLSLS